MPEIAIMNQSGLVSDDDIRAMIPAFERQTNTDLAAVWPVQPMHFAFYPAGSPPPPGSWWLVFLVDSDQADDLAYHDLTDEGLPLSKVFVRTLREENASLSVGATHEICEMVVDPWLNGAYQSQTDAFWANEICDPVEDDRYGYSIGNVLVTDFVTPAWFAYPHAAGPYDYMRHVRAPFEVLTGGYAQKYEHNRGWVQITGTRARKSLSATAQPGSRRKRRERGPSAWHRSEPRWTV
jgi:hypothetical protein